MEVLPVKVPVRVAGVVEATERTKVRLPASKVVTVEIVKLVLTSIVPVPVELVVIVSEVPVKVRLLKIQLVPTATLVPKVLLVATLCRKVPEVRLTVLGAVARHIAVNCNIGWPGIIKSG